MKKKKDFFKTFRWRACLIILIAFQILINTLAHGIYPMWSFIGLFAFGIWIESEEHELTPFSILLLRILLVFSVFFTSFSFVRFFRTGKNSLDTAFFIILLVIHIFEMVAV